VIGALTQLKRDRVSACGGSKSNASGLACPTLPAPVKTLSRGEEGEQRPSTEGVNWASRFIK